MCLCGVLGAEIDALPSGVVIETKVFFDRNIKWLTQAYGLKGFDNSYIVAAQTLACLEGAMIMGKVMGDPSVFEAAAAQINL